MARHDITHILVRDSDGVVTEMAAGPFPSVPDGHTQHSPDASGYTSGPVAYDAGTGKLAPDQAAIAASTRFALTEQPITYRLQSESIDDAGEAIVATVAWAIVAGGARTSGTTEVELPGVVTRDTTAAFRQALVDDVQAQARRSLSQPALALTVDDLVHSATVTSRLFQ